MDLGQVTKKCQVRVDVKNPLFNSNSFSLKQRRGAFSMLWLLFLPTTAIKWDKTDRLRTAALSKTTTQENTNYLLN